jgi:hypothetical protein
MLRIQNVACWNLFSTCHEGLRNRLRGLVVRVPGYRFRGPGFDSQRYQIFWEVLCLERGPLSLVRITEELLEWKSSGSGIENRESTAVGIRCAGHATPSIRKRLAITSPTSGGRSVDIVRLRTKTTEFVWGSSLFSWVHEVSVEIVHFHTVRRQIDGWTCLVVNKKYYPTKYSMHRLNFSLFFIALRWILTEVIMT